MVEKSKNPVWMAARPYMLGGSAGMLATCVIQPIDMIKVQKQLYEVFTHIRTDEGIQVVITPTYSTHRTRRVALPNSSLLLLPRCTLALRRLLLMGAQ
eukprot:2715576-Pyramimonas_sp.AAC.1